MKTKLFSSFCLLVIFASGLLAAFEESKDYFALFMEGKKVGYAVYSRSEKDSKVTTTQDVVITISRGDVEMTVTMKETSLETNKGEPLSFESSQDLSLMKMVISGTVEPNGMMTVTASSAGNKD